MSKWDKLCESLGAERLEDKLVTESFSAEDFRHLIKQAYTILRMLPVSMKNTRQAVADVVSRAQKSRHSYARRLIPGSDFAKQAASLASLLDKTIEALREVESFLQRKHMFASAGVEYRESDDYGDNTLVEQGEPDQKPGDEEAAGQEPEKKAAEKPKVTVGGEGIHTPAKTGSARTLRDLLKGDTKGLERDISLAFYPSWFDRETGLGSIKARVGKIAGVGPGLTAQQFIEDILNLTIDDLKKNFKDTNIDEIFPEDPISQEDQKALAIQAQTGAEKPEEKSTPPEETKGSEEAPKPEEPKSVSPDAAQGDIETNLKTQGLPVGTRTKKRLSTVLPSIIAAYAKSEADGDAEIENQFGPAATAWVETIKTTVKNYFAKKVAEKTGTAAESLAHVDLPQLLEAYTHCTRGDRETARDSLLFEGMSREDKQALDRWRVMAGIER